MSDYRFKNRESKSVGRRPPRRPCPTLRLQKLARPAFCALALLVVLSSMASAGGPETRTRRILYNFDGDSCLVTPGGGTKGPVAVTAEDVRRQIGEVAYDGSQVDTILVCVNAQVMYYPTKVGTMRGATSTTQEQSQWPASEKQRHANLERFFADGVDPYSLMLAETRRLGREALLTFRVNDDHGNDFLRTQFWIDHPEYRLGKGALDFKHEAVRSYVLALIDEALRRYDCDGLELDFNRFPTFFTDVPMDERIAIMNSFVEQVRHLVNDEAARKGRPLVLGVRMPSDYGRRETTYEVAREAGCDAAAWAANGWIDYVAVSEFLFERYLVPIASWKEAVRGVPIYGGIECTEGGSKEQYLSAQKYRRAAGRLWNEGADGIYLFNFFTTREYGDESWDPPFEALSEIGDKQTLLRAADSLPAVKVGFTQLRTNLPGGRHANVTTMRACVVESDGSGRAELAADLTRQPDSWTQFAGWSPDGTTAIIGRGWESPENARWEEEHKTFRFTPEGWLYDTYLLDLVSGELSNVTAVDRVSFYNSGVFFWPQDASKLGFTALIDGASRPWQMDRDGRNKVDVSGSAAGFAYGFSSSPDGRRIAYHRDYQVYIAQADGSEAKRVETGNPFNFVPLWSPDGAWLVFVSGEHKNCHPHVVRSDGTGLLKVADRGGYQGTIEFLDVFDFHGGSSDVPAWSADSWIYYTAQIGDSVELMRVAPGRAIEQLTSTPAGTAHYHPNPSPDGQWLLFGSKRDGIRNLYIMEIGTRRELKLTSCEVGHAAMWPHWQQK